MRRGLTTAAVMVALALVGCGGEDAASGRTKQGPRVLAAASLRDVLPRIDAAPVYAFAGSGALARQLREGAGGDVYAAADRKLPEQLHRAGIVDQPRVFAINRLVLIAARRSAVHGVGDLRRHGVKLVIGAAGVPVGDYTRAALERMDLGAALGQVVSEEDDVNGVVGKVALGEADAGFVYATDVAAVADDVRVVELPPAAQPRIEYAIAVVRGAKHRSAAKAFVARVLGSRGRAALRAAGFELP